MIAGLIPALLTLAVPVTSRVMLALGFSVVTITGVTVTVSAVKDEILGALGTGPIAALQLAGLAGTWVGLGIVFGAVTFAVSLWTLTKATSVLGVGGGS